MIAVTPMRRFLARLFIPLTNSLRTHRLGPLVDERDAA